MAAFSPLGCYLVRTNLPRRFGTGFESLFLVIPHDSSSLMYAVARTIFLVASLYDV
jgi:hypothetical protein